MTATSCATGTAGRLPAPCSSRRRGSASRPPRESGRRLPGMGPPHARTQPATPDQQYPIPLIPAWVQVPHPCLRRVPWLGGQVASHVLGLIARRIRADPSACGLAQACAANRARRATCSTASATTTMKSSLSCATSRCPSTTMSEQDHRDHQRRTEGANRADVNQCHAHRFARRADRMARRTAQSESSYALRGVVYSPARPRGKVYKDWTCLLTPGYLFLFFEFVLFAMRGGGNRALLTQVLHNDG
jgi:hypothetical protein